jgi:hypothetical protein
MSLRSVSVKVFMMGESVVPAGGNQASIASSRSVASFMTVLFQQTDASGFR